MTLLEAQIFLIGLAVLCTVAIVKINKENK